MSCNWGTELWDQFDNLEKHTSWGIDFLERYSKFVKERADIELSYAKQIRSLSKKYHPKRSREDESRYTWCLAFSATLRQLNELSDQREELAENLNTQIVCELTRYTQEVKAERKTVSTLHYIYKRRFERDCKEAERAQQVSDRIDLDNKTDGEKVRNSSPYTIYSHYLNLFSQRIQDMEERRIERICESMRSSAEAERKVVPVVSSCLDVMMDAAEGIQPRMVSAVGGVVEVYKSGFDPPGDVEFDDYSASMRRSISESSYLDNRMEGRRHSRKLWPFIRKNKPPPPPPTSPLPGGVANSPQSLAPASREPIAQRLNDLMTSGSRTRKQCLRSLKRGCSGPADCSHLPPEQRRKKLQTRINNINQEIQREREQRDALLKMREVYEQNPQMGDADSLEPRLEEVKQSLQRQEEDPDGSYTEDHSAELQFKSRSSEFDDDFEDEEPLPSIGTCKSLYPFQGQNEGTLSLVEGELLSVVEEDKGDGWTRVRRNLEEEGYVPTSYIKVFLDSSAKGAMTYI
uniref:Formin binding protein 1a n=1 Tax=Cyclopterus lumpus TaxID=8103 RepID=A0A8C2WX95_CYCLU